MNKKNGISKKKQLCYKMQQIIHLYLEQKAG